MTKMNYRRLRKGLHTYTVRDDSTKSLKHDCMIHDNLAMHETSLEIEVGTLVKAERCSRRKKVLCDSLTKDSEKLFQHSAAI